jgi:predicted CXXCH cytochrome family protein
MTSRLERLLIACMFALLTAGITLVVVRAQSGTAVPAGQTSSDCATCHSETQTTWQNGAHGKAGSDPIFLAEWNKQGKPGACLVCHTTGYDPATATYKADGVTCESCHSPVPTDHPKSPMPAVRTTELCGRCHSDTRSETPSTNISAHDQKGLDCAACHDPHSASLKTVPGPRTAEKTDKVSQLCITCHKETNMDFSLTAHAQRNVSCADCHVSSPGNTKNPGGAPHTPPDHTFKASLASCNTCHLHQMHSPTQAVNPKESTTTLSAEPTPAIQAASIMPEPNAVGPIGFSIMAGLIGLTGGMVLAPWLERWYRRAVKQNHEDQDE